MRIELTTFSLATRHSTAELLVHLKLAAPLGVEPRTYGVRNRRSANCAKGQ
jgi:hypothetical protein